MPDVDKCIKLAKWKPIYPKKDKHKSHTADKSLSLHCYVRSCVTLVLSCGEGRRKLVTRFSETCEMSAKTINE